MPGSWTEEGKEGPLGDCSGVWYPPWCVGPTTLGGALLVSLLLEPTFMKDPNYVSKWAPPPLSSLSCMCVTGDGPKALHMLSNCSDSAIPQTLVFTFSSETESQKLHRLTSKLQPSCLSVSQVAGIIGSQGNHSFDHSMTFWSLISVYI